MSETEDKLRARAKALLEDGTVNCVIGWEKGRFENQTTPVFITDPADCDRLVWNEYCVNALAKYVRDRIPAGKVALCTRGCEARAINRMIADNQFKRDAVYLLGLPCPGMVDRTTGEKLKKCVECRHQNPVISDEMLADAVEDKVPDDRFKEVDEIEAMSTAERLDYYDKVFSKCIRCYACRNVCPCCTCRLCFVDQYRVGWQGKQNNLAENRFYNLTRAFHIGDRCIECGECERVCPMDLPLMTLNRKLIKDLNGLFGDFESGMDPKSIDPLVTYKTDDIEEFM